MKCIDCGTVLIQGQDEPSRCVRCHETYQASEIAWLLTENARLTSALAAMTTERDEAQREFREFADERRVTVDGLIAEVALAQTTNERLKGVLARCAWHVERTWRESHPESDGRRDWTALLADLRAALGEGRPSRIWVDETDKGHG